MNETEQLRAELECAHAAERGANNAAQTMAVLRDRAVDDRIATERCVASLKARCEALYKMLMRLEWEGATDCSVCILCDRRISLRDPNFGHAEACELAALLGEPY